MKIYNSSPAEKILRDLGVEDASEIDLEAIAYTQGATVKYRNLSGCDAKIVGFKDKAIITINEGSSEERRRFSLAHELGHWHLHRGRSFICRASDIDNPSKTSFLDPEFVADKFAASLIMPSFLFLPAAKNHVKASFEAIVALSIKFQSSLSSAAIRYIEADEYPLILACYEGDRLVWLVKSKQAGEKWWLHRQLDKSTNAYDLVYGKPARKDWVKIEADAWFSNHNAGGFEVKEQSISWVSGKILVLIMLAPEMVY